ncbi:MAG: glycosyltransferase [Pseudomonadales bacterium]
MSNPSTAVVAIGRNEGERLRQCLASAAREGHTVVYVDSGSTDDSVALARSLGTEVVKLDMSVKFTAARARNAGFRRVLELDTAVDFVQFVDGDCEIVYGWLALASRFLRDHGDVAIVTGRRRERYPTATIYNTLCDMEWARPPGLSRYCGGDVMARAVALRAVGGYRDDLIAGEEPELCVRLRAAGWQIYTLEADMTLHDAAMSSFRQWWLRTKRSGYAYAAGARLHGRSTERFWVRESLRAWIWGAGPPLSMLALWLLLGPVALLVLCIYPIQMIRLISRDSGPAKERVLRGVFNTLCRFPELAGQIQFLRDAVLRRDRGLIEYK